MHAKPVVPITFIYGEDDPDTLNLLAVPIREKLGKEMVLRKTGLSGQALLDNHAGTARRIQRYLIRRSRSCRRGLGAAQDQETTLLLALPDPEPEWRLFITAKHPGQEMLLAVPMRRLGIPVDGLTERSGVRQKLSKP